MTYRWWALALLLGTTSLSFADDPPKKQEPQKIEVPYRRTLTQHILVRAKINGKGPFNFIIDSGAPLVFVNTAVGKKLGLEVDEKTGAATLARLEIEGGVVIEKMKVRIETPFQLEGMNGMGLAGAELHGILGYTLMARFKIEVDFTRDKMGWTRLADFKPPAPQGIGAKAAAAAGGLEMMGTIMKFMGFLYGTKTTPDAAPRGFLGIELAEKGDAEKTVSITSVLAKSPASEAGLKAGDQIMEINGRTVGSLADARRLTASATVGQSLEIQVRRGSEMKTVRVAAGEGL